MIEDGHLQKELELLYAFLKGSFSMSDNEKTRGILRAACHKIASILEEIDKPTGAPLDAIETAW